MASTIPISNTNIVTLLGIESAYGVVATVGKQIAYDQNTLVRNQALEKNTELRGNRQMGTRVPGNKNPSGTLLGHQTDIILPMSYYAMLGSITSTELGGSGIVLTATQSATVGSTPPEAGAHSYVAVISKGGSGIAKRTLHTTLDLASATLTADGTHKVTVARTGGTLPSGWTWALYRTEADDDPTDVTKYKLVTGTIALAANVTSYADDVADASLGAAVPTVSDSTYGDYKHVIIPGDTLPSLSIERKHPYVADSAAYFVALGSVVNKGSVKITGTGYYDIGLDYLFGSLSGPNASSFDAAPDDWRFGEKIHHAMALAANVKLDSVAFAKFQDLTISTMNNLDTTDYPVGGQGDRGSLVPLQAETTVAGTLKVTDPDSISLAQDTSVLHTVEIQHDFATFGHYINHKLYGVQFDPTDPAPSGQGILKFTANGSASQPVGGNQIVIEIANGVAGAQYTGS